MRPYVLLSAAMSADGYLDDCLAAAAGAIRAEDLDRVDELPGRVGRGPGGGRHRPRG